MPLLIPPRVDEPELLDEHDAPRAEMERSLRDLRRINRFLGGLAIYRTLLAKLAGDPRPLAVVDLGAGTADALESIGGDGMRIALDFKIDHLLYLREGSRVRRVVGDATRLPFRDRTVDVVTSAHFFHHFDPDTNATILRDSLRIARRGVIVNDTRRHYVPLFVIWLLGALRLVGRITAYDGPASVRRAYTVEEAQEVGSRTGASVEVVKLWPFRFGMLLRSGR